MGARILGHVEEMQNVISGVLHHHEWYDGSGYPSGRAGEGNPLQARIIAITDAFDALTTDRPPPGIIARRSSGSSCASFRRPF